MMNLSTLRADAKVLGSSRKTFPSVFSTYDINITVFSKHRMLSFQVIISTAGQKTSGY
jgi:hypothetical protein